MDSARSLLGQICPAFRFTTRDLLVLMLLVGIGLGWWSDHRRMRSQLELAMLRIMYLQSDRQPMDSMQASLRLRLAEMAMAGPAESPAVSAEFATSDELIAFVRAGPRLFCPPRGLENMEFVTAVWAVRDTPVADEALPRLVNLLAHRDEHVRARAAWALGAIAEERTIVWALVPLLNDPAPSVQWHAARALGELKSAARAALPALQARMADDDCKTAAFAAVCVSRIDPRQALGFRLKQLVTNKHPENRKQAIQHLRYHLPHDEVAKVLSSAFASESDEEIRSNIAIALNQLPQ